jgi:predicted MFS family arabinose efflux permease
VSPRVEAAVHRTFSSLRDSRNFRLYLIGQVVSAAGTWMNFTASSWLVLQLSNSGTALGVNAALAFGPVLVIGPFGGVLADRFDKRRILTWTQATFAVIALTLFTLIFTDAVQLWMVFALSLGSGIVTAFDNPARQSFYVEMVGEDAITNAVSLNSAAFTGARIVGPAVAGVLIATVGIAWPFLLDGVSYLAVIAALIAMRPDEMHPHKRTTRDRGHLVAGLRYVWETPELRRPLLVLAVIFTVSFQFGVLVPLLAERTFHGSAGTFGALSAVAGFGSFFGAITMAHRNAKPSMQVLAFLITAFGALLLAVGFSPSLPVAFAVMVPLGYVSMAFMITGNTMLQLSARPEARGRVMALYGAVFLGSTPIGSPVVGFVAEHLGVRVGFGLAGGAALVTGLVLILVLRREAASRATSTEARVAAA